MSSMKIAIVGAGPAGCMFARILTQSTAASSLAITIFEGEEAPNVRSQGGTLDLHPGSGLEAMKAANLMPEFEQYARYEGDALLVSDKNLVGYMQMAASASNSKTSRGAPEIDRFRLCQILLDSIPKDMIQWGKRLREVTEDAENESSKQRPSGRFTLHFRDGTSAGGFDLVVGADGAWSKVRPLVTDAQPYYSGIAGYTFTIPEASKTIPDTIKLLNGGNVFSQHDHKFIGHQQMGDDVVQVSAYWLEEDERWMDKTAHDSADADAIRRWVLDEKLHDWHPRLRGALEKCRPADAKVLPWSLYMLPVGQRWQHRRGVALLGDAAHLMTPWAGEGVNQALTDAKVLATDIAAAVAPTAPASSGHSQERSQVLDALDGAVVRYEAEMFARMAIMMKKTYDLMILTLFAPGGLQKNFERYLLAALESDLPMKMLTMPLVAVLTYTYFFFFRILYRPATSA